MTGYVRKDTTNNIADGNVINAADLDAEFDGVQDAFNASTGHKHDGTAGEGATINALGPTQDVTISATLLAPKTTNTVDIGSSALKFKDLFLAGNGSIGGTLAVTGVATFTAQPILSSLTASRAVFSDGSKGLVSNAITGTGNVVMSASPTLTGTIDAAALTASGNLTLSAGTANGVAYLNGSKVVTSGSALVFDGTTLTSNAGFSTGIASGGSYKLNYASNVDSRTWRAINDQNVFGDFAIQQSTTQTGTTYRDVYTALNSGVQYWSVGGSEQMRLTSTGLGIGTSSPTNALSVTGNANITGNTTLGDATTDTVTVNGYMGVGGAASSSIGVYLRSSALGSVDQIGYQSALKGTSAATTFIRGFSAFVGTEAASFTVANLAGYSASDASKGAGSTITNQHGLYIADQTQGTNNYGITSLVSSGTNKWNIYASGTAANYFAGDLRVGTTTAFASEKLSVFGSTFNDLAAGNGSANTSYDWLVGASGNVVYPVKIVVDQGSSSTIHGMSFYTSNAALPTEKMRITADGNVGIGTSSPAYKLDVSATARFSQGVQVQGSNLTAAASQITVDQLNTTTSRLISWGADTSTAGILTLGGLSSNASAGSATRLTLGTTEAVFNDSGADYDFRVESDTNTHALFVQGSDGFVGIGTSSPTAKLTISGTAATGATTFLSTGTTTNYNVGQFTNTGGSFYFGLDNNAGTAFTGSSAYGGVVGTGNSTSLGFVTNSTVRATIDSSGNLGLGVTPSAWNSVYRAFQLPFGASLTGRTDTPETLLASNTYRDSGGFKYFGTGLSTAYFQTGGVHSWHNAPTGTAGNAITFTQAMTLASDGRLRIAETTNTGANAKLIVGSGNAGTNGVIVANTANGAYAGLTLSNWIGSATTNGPYISFDNSTVGSWFIGSGNGVNTFDIATTWGTPLVRVNSSGNLGLGVTPSASTSNYRTLQIGNGSNSFSMFGQRVAGASEGFMGWNVYGGSNTTTLGSGFYYRSTADAASLYTQNAQHTWWIAPTGTAGNAITFTQAMTLDASGNLGIGTSSPASKLDVNSTASRVVDITSSNASGAFLRLVNSATALGYLGSAKAIFGTNLADLALDVSGANNLIFGTNDTERARIDSSGNLLVGKTVTTISTVGAVQYPDGTNAYSIAGTTNSTTTLQVYSTGASANRFYVGMGGTVYATNTTITAISDQRLKENIRDLDDGLSAVMALKPRKFDWKEGKGANIKDARGFIAQEFETVFPDMIEEWRDPAPEGEEAYKAINANLIPTLVKAIQELKASMDAVKAEFDAYKASHP